MDEFAESVGIAPAGFRLLVGVLLGYPISIGYRIFQDSMNVPLRHFYSFLSGLCIGYFCFGTGVVHTLITAGITYLMALTLPKTTYGCQLPIFVFNMAYLLIAYYYVSSSDKYDIDWTTAQCVLTLRLIGFGWDIVDGKAPEKELSDYQKINGLKSCPNPLEFLGYCFHWSGFLVGPQFSFVKYNAFLTGTNSKGKKLPIPYREAFTSFILGVIYLAISSIGGAYFPVSYILTEEYLASPLINKIIHMVISTRCKVSTYGGIWLLTDGHCKFSGLGFNPKTNTWDYVSNFYPSKFETATSLGDYIASFNVNTNGWVKEYVFKRLRFLGSKSISSITSLTFLAIWHGFAPGYFFNFFMEFLDVLSEDHLRAFLAPISKTSFAQNSVVQIIWKFICWVLGYLACAYGFTAFELKTFSGSIAAYQSVYWLGHIIPISFILLNTISSSFRGKKVKKQE